jgi:hypothetical protein
MSRGPKKIEYINSPVPFSPLHLPGFDFWLDSFDANNILEGTGPDDPAENGDAVILWRDRGPNAREFTFSNATYDTSGAIPHLDLASAIPHSTITNPLGATASIFLVYQSNDGEYTAGVGDAVGEVIGWSSNTAPGSGSAVGCGSPTVFWNSTSVPTRGELRTASNGNFGVLSIIGADFSSWSALRLWSRDVGAAHASMQFDGPAYAAIGCNSAISAAQRAQLVAYLLDRYS